MSQDIFNNINPSTTSGTQLASILNLFKDAVASGFIGASRPTNLQAGGSWVDNAATPTWYLKLWTGTLDITLFTMNSVSGTASISGSVGTFTISKASADTVSSILELVKSRVANLGQVLTGDIVGTVQGKGTANDGNNYTAWKIKGISTDDYTSSQFGCDLSFESVDDGSGTLSEKMRIKDGKLGIGTTAPEEKLHSAGNIKGTRTADDTVPAKVILRKKKLTGTGQTLTGETYASYLFNSTSDAGVEVDGAKIESVAIENHTATAHGTKLSLSIKKAGEIAFTEKAVFGSGLMELKDNVVIDKYLATKQQVDSTTTGADASVPLTNSVVKLTNASLVSINNLANPVDGMLAVIMNATGASITVKNDIGGTAANRVITGTGEDLLLSNNASILVAYDLGATRWRIVGGSGSGGGSANTITDDLTLSASDSLAINVLRGVQTFRVQGGSAAVTMSNTPFGTSPPSDGSIIYLLGNSDENCVTINKNDAADGCLLNGESITIYKGTLVGFMYSLALDRYIAMGGN